MIGLIKGLPRKVNMAGSPQPIVTFTSNVSGLYIPEIIAYVTPIQDLNGQSAPYPAGCGKNLYNKNATGVITNYYLDEDGNETSSNYFSISDYIRVQEYSTITVSGSSNSGGAPSICFYDSNKAFISGIKHSNYSFPHTYTIPTGAVYIRESVSNSYLDTFQLEAGSTATSYAPFENICPITGRTSVSVTHTGKNIVNIADQTFTRNKTITCNFPKGTYTVSAVVTSNDTDASACLIYFRNKNNVYIAHTFLGRNTRSSANITIDEDVGYIYLYASDTNSHAQGDTATWADIQIEAGSTATSYAPYTGQTVTISLNGTFYVGTVNLNTGVFTATGLLTTYTKNSSWTRNSSGVFYASAPNGIDDLYSCNMFGVFLPKGSSNALADGQCRLNSTARFINFKVTSCDTVDDFKAFLGDNTIQMVYTLETPQTIQLTPAQLRQITGTNNVFCSTGDVAVTQIWARRDRSIISRG